MGNLLARITSSKLLDLLASFESDLDPPEDIYSYVFVHDAKGEDFLTRSLLEGLPDRVERHFANFEIGKALEAIRAALDNVGPNLTDLDSNSFDVIGIRCRFL